MLVKVDPQKKKIVTSGVIVILLSSSSTYGYSTNENVACDCTSH